MDQYLLGHQENEFDSTYVVNDTQIEVKEVPEFSHYKSKLNQQQRTQSDLFRTQRLEPGNKETAPLQEE